MPTTTTAKAVLFSTGLAVGIALGVPAGGWMASQAQPEATAIVTPADSGADAYVARMTELVTGDEPTEDDPAFDCRIHGNRICGPGNSQGVPPGQYRDVQPGTTLVDFMLGQ